MALFSREFRSPSFFSVCVDFFLFPFLAALLGFSPAGMALIPLLLAARGFFLSYAISAFYFTFGPSGIGAAAVIYGLTLFSAVPVLFSVSCSALSASACTLRGEGPAHKFPLFPWLLLVPAAFLQWFAVPELIGRAAVLISFS